MLNPVTLFAEEANIRARLSLAKLLHDMSFIPSIPPYITLQSVTAPFTAGRFAPCRRLKFLIFTGKPSASAHAQCSYSATQHSSI